MTINLSETALQIVLFQEQHGNLHFVKGVVHDFSGLGDIPDLLAQWENEDSRIILGIHPSLISMRELDIAISERKKARDILPLELEGDIALDGEELIFEALPFPNNTTLALWISQSRVAELIELFTKAGFEPEIVTSSFLNWKYLIPENITTNIALTDGTAVAIYNSNKEPLFYRALRSPEELSTTLTAVEFSRQIKAEKIFKFGEAGRTKDNILPLNEGLSTTFVNDNIASINLASAYAIAMASLEKDSINFRRGPLAFTKAVNRLKRKLLITAILGIAVILLIFAELGVRYYLTHKDANSVETSIKGIYKSIFPERTKPVDEVEEIKAEIKRLGGNTSQSALTPLLQIANIKGDGISGFYEINIENNQISGKGSAGSTEAVNQFKTSADKIFNNVTITDIKSHTDGSTGFSFQADLQGGNQ